MTDKTEAQPEALRVRKYIDRRRASKGLDREHIHGFDVGDDAEALLLTSDIEALLGRIASLEAQLSARQAAPDGWRLVPEQPTQAMCDAAKYTVHAGLSVFKWADGYYAMLSAAPPPPEREPLTDEQIDELCGEANRGIYIELDQYLKAFRDAERAHGIGATND